MMPYLAQEPKDHKASEASSGQAERDELDGMSGGWVGPGSHFSMMMGRLKCFNEAKRYLLCARTEAIETQQEDVFECRIQRIQNQTR